MVLSSGFLLTEFMTLRMWRSSILVLLLPLVSCATYHRCVDRYGLEPDTVRVVTVRDSIVFRDTTITVVLPGEHSIDTVTIPCPPPPPAYVPDTAYAKTTLAEAKAWWDYPAIRLDLKQNDTIMKFYLDSAITEIYRLQTELEIIKQVQKQPRKKIYDIALWAWGGFFIVWLLNAISKLLTRRG